MIKPLVSIITPTKGRERLLPSIYSCVRSQDWPNIEWLIDDDGPTPSAFLGGSTDIRVKYYHSSSRRSVGTKRNHLVERSLGEYIVHFDDDDYYAPNYISQLVSSLAERNAECVKLSGFFIYDRTHEQFFYWDQTKAEGLHFVCKRGQPCHSIEISSQNSYKFSKFRLGFGFSYAYRRSLWNCVKFPDINFSEDLSFMTKAAESHSVILLPDRVGLCLHIMHGANLSGCFPQFIIPSFLMDVFFPQARAYFANLR